MERCSICIAVFGPDNSPLFIEKGDNDSNSLNIEAMLFSALYQSPPTQSKSTDFLGCIQKIEQYQIWGYQGSLKYKILIITKEIPGAIMPPLKMRDFCEKVRDCVFDAILDPFYLPFSPFNSPHFKSKISNIYQGIQPIPINS